MIGRGEDKKRRKVEWVGGLKEEVDEEGGR